MNRIFTIEEDCETAIVCAVAEVPVKMTLQIKKHKTVTGENER